MYSYVHLCTVMYSYVHLCTPRPVSGLGGLCAPPPPVTSLKWPNVAFYWNLRHLSTTYLPSKLIFMQNIINQKAFKTTPRGSKMVQEAPQTPL